jgi:hypothetical protein
MLLITKVDALSKTSEPEIFNTVLADIVSATVQRENASEKLTNGEMKLLTTSLKTIATILPPQLVINESILDVSPLSQQLLFHAK